MALIDNLISYWKMDENAANTTIADSHGSNTGTASTNTNNLYDASGKIISAFDLNGSSEYWDTGSYPNLSSGFTFSIWFNSKQTNYSGFPQLMAADRTAEGGRSFQFRVNTDKKLEFIFWVGTSLFILTGTTTITENTYYHAAVTYDNSECILYLNGSSEDTDSSMSGAIDTSDLITFGARDIGYSSKWQGELDEAAIFGINKEASGISDLYNSGAGLAYPFAVGTNMQINIGDVFKDVDSLQINIGNVWKDVPQVLLNVGDTWKTVYG